MTTASAARRGHGPPATVHPHLPRFAQAITGLICLESLFFGTWPSVAVALALVLANLLTPRFSPVAWLFRQVARPPAALEPAAPARFSQGLAAVLLTAGLLLLAVGAETAGWAVVGVVGVVALFSAITGVCVGCHAWRLLRARRSAHEDLRAVLGLEGPGPWLVLVTAPGCARCAPAARELARAAGDMEVVEVDLLARPEARGLPVMSVPAALAVGRDGRIRAARGGAIGPQAAMEVVSAIAERPAGGHPHPPAAAGAGGPG